MSSLYTTTPVSIPDMVRVRASEVKPPPSWALVQRQLIKTMEDALDLFNDKYAYPGGSQFYTSTLDDAYETRSGRAQLYYVGADDKFLMYALQDWNATTRFYDDSVVVREGDPLHPRYLAQIHNDYYNGADLGDCDWFHMGEGNQPFYDLGAACPLVPENVRRAMRFADMYMGEDPEAPNYDSNHRIIRSPLTGSRGPVFHADVSFAKRMLEPTSRYRQSAVKPLGPPATYTTLHPVVKNLEPDWHENAGRRREVLSLFDEVVLNGDIPMNLAATTLVTNAYLYTGEEKYKRWVLEYVEAWMDRMERNRGIMPDNVGPTGQVGEKRGSQWWGGIWGWDSGRAGVGDLLIGSLVVASECALLLTGDFSYLDLLRSQLKMLLDNGTTRDDGEVLVPYRHSVDGWADFRPMNVRDLTHLYHASMSQDDYRLIATLRDAAQDRDWNQASGAGDKGGGEPEHARFQYYDGRNPDWPESILRAEYDHVTKLFEAMRRDSRDLETRAREAFWPPNPIVSKGLIQVTMGTPQNIYRGGLLRAQARYFDIERGRPGLPRNVAGLVDKLGADEMGIHLVNLSNTETRSLVLQAGAFGEHQFTEVRYDEVGTDGLSRNPASWVRADWPRVGKSTRVDRKHFIVELPPSTRIRLSVGLRRFVNQPTYAFPWHGDRVPTPLM